MEIFMQCGGGKGRSISMGSHASGSLQGNSLYSGLLRSPVFVERREGSELQVLG